MSLVGGHSARTLVGTALRLGNVGANLGFAILAAKLLGAAAFGQYVSLVAFAGLAAVGLSLGLPTMVAREVASARGAGQASLSAALIDWCMWSAVVLTVVVVLAAFIVPARFALTGLLIAASQAASLVASVHAGRERVLFASVANDLVRPVVSLGILAGVYAIGAASIEHALAAQIVGAVVGTTVNLVALGRERLAMAAAQVRFRGRFSPSHGAVLKLGLMLSGGQLLINATTQIDILVLTAIARPEDVAHYFAAARAALVVSFFFGIGASIAEPKITRLVAANDLPGVRAVVHETTLSGLGMSLLASVGAAVLAPFYLGWYGPSFLEALPCLLLMLVGLVGWSAFGPGQAVLRATRQDRTLLLVTLGPLCLNAALCALLVPHIGILGAAIGFSGQYITYGAAMSLICWRTRRLRTDIFDTDLAGQLARGVGWLRRRREDPLTSERPGQ